MHAEDVATSQYGRIALPVDIGVELRKGNKKKVVLCVDAIEELS